MFNTGEGGFRDRDLYVFCANASDGTSRRQRIVISESAVGAVKWVGILLQAL